MRQRKIKGILVLAVLLLGIQASAAGAQELGPDDEDPDIAPVTPSISVPLDPNTLVQNLEATTSEIQCAAVRSSRDSETNIILRGCGFLAEDGVDEVGHQPGRTQHRRDAALRVPEGRYPCLEADNSDVGEVAVQIWSCATSAQREWQFRKA